VTAAAPVSLKLVRPRTIVIPLDGSQVADAALPVAHHLAAAFQAEVQRVTVQLGLGDTDTRADVVLEGDPPEAILEHVESLRAPLVVMSGHGHSGWAKRIVGSVTEEVVRRSSAPVVVVGPNLDRSLPLLAPRTLLVAVGVPPLPPALIPAAAGWASTLRASVVLAHVVSPEVAEVAEAAGEDEPTLIPDLDSLAKQMGELGVADVRTELIVKKHRTRRLVGLADTLAPPVLIIAQAHSAEESDASDEVTYKLMQHSRWPILATVGR
jgi:hypothetical protein